MASRAAIAGAVVAIIVVIAAAAYIAGRGGAPAATSPAASPAAATTATGPAAGATTTATSPVATAPAATTTMQATATAGGLPKKIPIGLAIAVSGGYAVDGPRRLKGAQLAIKEMNDLLAKAGAPFRFVGIHEDTQGNPQKAVDVVKRFIANGIQVIVGPLSTSETAAVMPLANRYHVVVISPSSTGEAAAKPDDYVFRVAPPDSKQGPALATIIYKLGYRKLAIIARNDDYGRGLATLVADTFKKMGGEVKTILYQPDKPDLSAEVTQLATVVQGFGADKQTAVLVIAFDNDGLQILQKASKIPVLAKVRWFGPDSMARNTFIENPQVAEFLMKVHFLGTRPAIERNPVTKHFEEAYKAMYHEAPTPYAYYAYDAAWLAMLSVLVAGKYDGTAIKAVLPTVGAHYMGATGQKVFDKNGDCAIANYALWTVAKVDGKYVFKTIGMWHDATKTIEWFNK